MLAEERRGLHAEEKRATKFGNTSLVRFGAFDSATIVTCGDVPEKYKAFDNVVEVAP